MIAGSGVRSADGVGESVVISPYYPGAVSADSAVGSHNYDAVVASSVDAVDAGDVAGDDAAGSDAGSVPYSLAGAE